MGTVRSATIATDAVLKTANLAIGILFSAVGQATARMIETLIIAEAMGGWLNDLAANMRPATSGPERPPTAARC